MRTSVNQVSWCSLVWFPGRIPKAAFILWLAVRGRLGTLDRIHWSTYSPICFLCGSEQEIHEHLFFTYQASRHIWETVQEKGNFLVPSQQWESLTQWLAYNWRGNSFETRIRKLCIASTVYQIWKERNARLHINSHQGTSFVVEKNHLLGPRKALYLF